MRFTLSMVRDGYKIPFVALPPPKFSSNNTSALKDSLFDSEAISDLLRTKCVEILDHQPDIVNPLSVSIQPSGKKRLILDLRHVNSYVFKRKFRCEDISVALQIFAKGFYLFKFDLKSGYHHVEIFPEHRKYLAFSWDLVTMWLNIFSSQFCPLVCHPHLIYSPNY